MNESIEIRGVWVNPASPYKPESPRTVTLRIATTTNLYTMERAYTFSVDYHPYSHAVNVSERTAFILKRVFRIVRKLL